MTDPERYQREFDQILRDTEEAHKHAEFLRGVERIEQLFSLASSHGIEAGSVGE